MRIRDLLERDPEDDVGEIGVLGALVGVVVGVLLGPDGNPLLWASLGGVAGLVLGLLLAELR